MPNNSPPSSMPQLCQDRARPLTKLNSLAKSMLGLKTTNDSLAQRLPSDVLHRVILYVVEEGRPRFQRVVCNKSNMKAMMNVCSVWRQAARDYLWRELDIVINVHKRQVFMQLVGWSGKFNWSDLSTALVRELYVKVSGAGIASGDALKLLIKFMKGFGTFTNAYKLCVVMTEGMKGSIDSRDIAISNSLELAQLLRSMTPAATMSKVMWADLSTRMEQHNEEVFGLFVDSLCSNTKGSMLDFGELLLRHPSTIDCISQLSVLKLSCRDSPNVHSSLVHKCANVLQYLDIGIHRAKALIYDVNDVPVVYPKLLHLQMYMAGLNDSSAPVFAPGIVPFPVLKSLQLQMGYPFGDDVMFRGNSATLEELEIRLSREMMAMLNNSQAFGKEYKNLKRVLVNELGHNGYQSLSSDDTVHKFIRSLANNACRMNLMCGGPNTCLVALTRHDDYCFEYIQELTLWRDRVSLYNMLCLLKALPILTRLTCSIGENGSEFDRISANDLPDHIAYTYSDTGMHLKTLRFPHSKDKSKIANVNFIMLLALVCPNFRPVEILEGFMSYYYDSVVKATRSGPFSKYAPCLLRLFEGSKVINTRHSGHVKR